MARIFYTLGMFIIDEFEYRDSDGKVLDNPHSVAQVGGGGTYAAVGARMFLAPNQIRMVVDQGSDFPEKILDKLLVFGHDMWLFRKRKDGQTTRALNKYVGQKRGFEYTTPRIRLTPKDLQLSNVDLSHPSYLHFICSPTRAIEILKEVKLTTGWKPLPIFEPIPDRCIPEEFPALKKILPEIFILSPNAAEALALLGKSEANLTRESIEWAAHEYLKYGIGENGSGSIVIRSGELGAYVAKPGQCSRWISPYWQPHGSLDHSKTVDVTGAGNAFLGGLCAGLHFTQNVFEAFYASVAASFVIEQFGLPDFDASSGLWNNHDPVKRLQEIRDRHAP